MTDKKTPPKTPPNAPWPTDIKILPNKAAIEVSFDNGEVLRLEAELLRVFSPSAEVQGHGNDEKKLVPAKRHVTISDIKPIGHYAARIIFSDGHDTGLFTWETIYDYGRRSEQMMKDYSEELAKKGLSRNA